MRGLMPYALYRSADRDSSNFAKLCPTTPKPTRINRNSTNEDYGEINMFKIIVTRHIVCFYHISNLSSSFSIKYNCVPLIFVSSWIIKNCCSSKICNIIFAISIMPPWIAVNMVL